MLKIIIFAVILLLSPNFSFSDEVCRFLYLDKNCNYSNRSHREFLLNQLSDSLNCLNNLIPNPKPSEIEWVNKEKKAFDKMIEAATSDDDKLKIFMSDRYIQFDSSIEWKKIKIKEDLKELINLNDQINSYYRNSQIKSEIITWAKFSSELIDSRAYWNDQLIFLKEKILVSLTEDYKCRIQWKPEPNLRLGPWTTYYFIGINIYKDIVIPYIEGKITK